jgi:hypothetical protein
VDTFIRQFFCRVLWSWAGQVSEDSKDTHACFWMGL